MYIGIMSGTSMDAVDAVLVSFANTNVEVLETTTQEIPERIKNNLLKLIQQAHCDIRLLGETDTQLGKLFAKTCNVLLKKSAQNRKNITAIGCHGQTIYHHPSATHPFTMQIGDPNIIAAQTGITTVSDFRRRDLALGGQGAPLTPAFHNYAFSRTSCDQWVLNIGGIANLTHLPSDKSQPVIGLDTGPGNTLLDLWHQKHRQLPIDFDGEWAKTGEINQPLLNKLLDDPYFKKTPPKSTGREYFNLAWLDRYLQNDTKPEDIQATLTELTATTIANSILNKKASNIIWVCGGGAFNTFLMQRLKKHCAPASVKSSDEKGINPKWMEAAAFAWLAKQTIEKKPGNIPSVTGASTTSILGSVYFA